MHAAAVNGQLGVLKYLRASGCPWSEATIELAERAGHQSVVVWLIEAGCPGRESLEPSTALEGPSWTGNRQGLARRHRASCRIFDVKEVGAWASGACC